MNKGNFARVNSCPVPPATLAGNGSCNLSVTFTPTVAGARSAQLVISHDGGGSPLSVPLSGTGLASLAPSTPEKSADVPATPAPGSTTETAVAVTPSSVAPSGSTTPVASARLSGSALDFGVQAVGTLDSPQTIVLKNSGSAPLMIGTIEIVGTSRNDFAQTNNCGSSLGAGQSCTLRITFTPQRHGVRTAFINILDSTKEGRRQVRLEGVGQRSQATRRPVPAGRVVKD
jgi:hypothetical protein